MASRLRARSTTAASACCLLLLVLQVAHGFKESDFKKCADAGFCRRLRGKAGPIFNIKPDSLALKGSVVSAVLVNTAASKEFSLAATAFADGVVRLLIDEPGAGRYAITDIVQPTFLERNADWRVAAQDEAGVTLAAENVSVAITFAPFTLSLAVGGKPAIAFNSRGLLNIEHRRTKEEETDPGACDGCWEETFNGHTDTKPRGPQGLSLDATFPGAAHVYGLPERATSLALKPTAGNGVSSEPYRLYNLDVFEYLDESPFGLYGSIPFLLAHQPGLTTGLLWLNAAEMYVDVSKAADGTASQWVAESGVIDLFLFPGPTPAAVVAQYAAVTGTTALPQLFSIGYHQCRWNYNDEADARGVNAGFDTHAIPYDVLWLDIEHTNGKRYLTWDKYKFPNPVQLQDDVAAGGRRMVTIVDPHVKRDYSYYIFKEAEGAKHYVRNKQGGDFDGCDPSAPNAPLSTPGTAPGTACNRASLPSAPVIISSAQTVPPVQPGAYAWGHACSRCVGLKQLVSNSQAWCWPGSSSYLDVTSPVVREWWAQQFTLDRYQGSTPHLYIWNDMNEPSVFNGPEITMPKDNLHYGDAEHRDVHNVYGLYYHQGTAEGLALRGRQLYGPDGDRPFVLSRAFFPGTQRVGPIWTGDNTAKWAQLRVSLPMLMTLGLTGLPFSGADVGGFFGNPDQELLTRWYQLGAFYPFFRGHAHLETQRREPWVFGEPTTTRIRDAIRERYALLPYIYTLFRHANLTGAPVVAPTWFYFTDDKETFALDEQMMVGPAVLVRPVTSPGAASVDVTLPRASRWFDALTGAELEKASWLLGGSDAVHKVPVTPDAIPAFYRGGHIVARRERPRRSTVTQATDPYTLVVATDAAQTAEGDLYLDDGRSYAFTRGEYAHRVFKFDGAVLHNAPRQPPAGVPPGSATFPGVVVERIVFLGLPKKGSFTATLPDGKVVPLVLGPLSQRLPTATFGHVLRAPGVPIADDWSIYIAKA